MPDKAENVALRGLLPTRRHPLARAAEHLRQEQTDTRKPLAGCHPNRMILVQPITPALYCMDRL